MKPAVRATIESSLRECEAHRHWIARARAKLSGTFPLTAESLAGLDEREVELVDQLIYRFTKLQDSMARRLLPSLHELLEGTDEPVPFLDIVNRLEALGIVPSASEWQMFRNLRNNLAHDYPESREQTAITLNQLYSDLPRLETLFENARREYERRSPGIPAQ
ncbi:MAG: hypothetical protein ACLFNT_15085 [Spirochaetales bacterium]